MNQIIKELHVQYVASVEMFTLAIGNCPDTYWERVFGDNAPFWKEAYHSLYYLWNLTCSSSEGPSRTPFGFEFDPRLSSLPNSVIARKEILSCITQAREHMDKTFSDLTEQQLTGADNYAPDRYRSIHHRLLYGLRHLQHHTGKLTGYLFCNGIDYDPWR